MAKIKKSIIYKNTKKNAKEVQIYMELWLKWNVFHYHKYLQSESH